MGLAPEHESKSPAIRRWALRDWRTVKRATQLSDNSWNLYINLYRWLWHLEAIQTEKSVSSEVRRSVYEEEEKLRIEKGVEKMKSKK